MKSYISPIVSVVGLVIVSVGILSLLYGNLYDSEPVDIKPVPVKMAITDHEHLLEYINTMPQGDFKSNLLVVIATEFAGDSDNLNELMLEYARMQMQKLQKKNLN